MSFRARVRTLVKVCSHDAALLEFMLEVLVHMSSRRPGAFPLIL